MSSTRIMELQWREKTTKAKMRVKLKNINDRLETYSKNPSDHKHVIKILKDEAKREKENTKATVQEIRADIKDEKELLKIKRKNEFLKTWARELELLFKMDGSKKIRDRSVTFKVVDEPSTPSLAPDDSKVSLTRA